MESLLLECDYQNVLDNFSAITTNKSAIAVFAMDNFGPSLINYSDISGSISQNFSEQDLQNLAVNLMVAIGQGHAFSEGVFNLPAGNSRSFRMILISFRFKDKNSPDVRLRNTNLCQVALFIPKNITTLLPSCCSYEQTILQLVSQRLENLEQIYELDLEQLKYDIFKSMQIYL